MMLDDTLKLLSREPRRKILYFMEDADDNVFRYEEVAEETIDEVHQEEEEKNRFKTQLVHVHLPKMEEIGVVENDQRSETVRYVQDGYVEDILEIVQKYDN